MTDLSGYDGESFATDLTRATATVGAPTDAGVAEQAFKAFRPDFTTGTVLWRCTDRSGDPLSFRLFPLEPVNTQARAISAGLLDQRHPLMPLATSWSTLYDANTQHSYAFDSDFGLTKTWIYFGSRRPAAEILSAPSVPRAIARRGAEFHERGLRDISFAAIDWRYNTVVLDFDISGPLTPESLASLVATTGAPAVSARTADTVLAYISRDHCVALAVDPANGYAVDCGFSVMDVPTAKLPRLPARLEAFFADAPTHAKDEFNVVGWSFGKKGPYMKAERQYHGDIRALLASWTEQTADRSASGE
ncbi:aromatic prenyltransferase [Streptomyces sp. NPDC020681]|uniref:aromatic prenyltransferase n=1 Tax=Streptomyces sp. NPDC020681 TaxID=3365083 RepID=UPI00378C0FBD